MIDVTVNNVILKIDRLSYKSFCSVCMNEVATIQADGHINLCPTCGLEFVIRRLLEIIQNNCELNKYMEVQGGSSHR